MCQVTDLVMNPRKRGKHLHSGNGLCSPFEASPSRSLSALSLSLNTKDASACNKRLLSTYSAGLPAGTGEQAVIDHTRGGGMELPIWASSDKTCLGSISIPPADPQQELEPLDEPDPCSEILKVMVSVGSALP